GKVLYSPRRNIRTAMANCSDSGTSHNVVVSMPEGCMGRTGRVLAYQCGPQELVGLKTKSRRNYLGQFAGPHMGAGAPPSAKETAENAPTNRRPAKNNLATRFIGPSYRHANRGVGPNAELFENRAIKRRLTDKYPEFT